MRKKEGPPEFQPEIRRGRIAVLKVYEVSDDELARLARGAGDSLYLNFGIAVLSIAITALIALLTTSIPSDRVFVVFVTSTVLCFLCGIVLMLLWVRTRVPTNALVQEIRSRMPPEGEAQEMPAERPKSE